VTTDIRTEEGGALKKKTKEGERKVKIEKEKNNRTCDAGLWLATRLSLPRSHMGSIRFLSPYLLHGCCRASEN